VVERKHSSAEQVQAGSTVHCAFQGLHSVDLAFGLTIAPLHFYRIAERINVLVNGAGEPHDRRKVSFYRVVDPSRKRVCFSTTQDAIETHGEAPHCCEGRRAFLESFDFSRLFCGEFSSWFNAERGRDNRRNRVPCFRISDWFKNLVLPDGPHLFLFFGSAPSGQEPLQV
jgi:hypothetical protein